MELVLRFLPQSLNQLTWMCHRYCTFADCERDVGRAASVGSNHMHCSDSPVHSMLPNDVRSDSTIEEVDGLRLQT